MKPKIFVSIDTINVGGPGKGILQFLRCGGNELAQPIIVSFDTGSIEKWQFRDEVQKLDTPFLALKQRMTYDPLLISQAYHLIKKHKVQILQSHGYKGHVLCLALKIMAGLPWIAFVHGWTSEDFKIKLYSKLDRFILGFADRVVVVSESLKKQLNMNWIDGKKVRTIVNATDPSEYKELSIHRSVRDAHGIKDDEKVVGVIGRFSPEKGHKDFIDAFRLVREHIPDIKAMLVGEGQDKDLLMEKVKKYKLDEHVIFTGYQKQMVPYYLTFDLVVIPSLSEGMPNVALEAMLFEKPVVATDVGGIPEVVIDNITGRLVKPMNPELLADAIMNVISDSELMSQYGKAGKKRILSEFNPKTRVDKIISLYRELLSEEI